MILIVLILIYMISKLFESKTESQDSTTYVPTMEELGKIGEEKVKQVLMGNIDGEQFVLNDITILDKFGNKSQIDHIVVNRFGVHVIETKNWSGNIYGNSSDSNWIESFDFSDKTFRLYNPIMQNKTHIKRLQSNIGFDIPIQNIVCFSNVNANLMVNEKEICYLYQLLDRINKGNLINDPNFINKTYRKIKQSAI